MKTCPQCTYQNHGRRRRCEMCNTSLYDVASDAGAEKGRKGETSGKRARSASSSQRTTSQDLLVHQSQSSEKTEASPEAALPLFSNGKGTAVTIATSQAKSRLATSLSESSNGCVPAVPEDVPAPPSGMPCLFSTAGGSAIKISSKALELAQKKLAGMDDESGNASKSSDLRMEPQVTTPSTNRRVPESSSKSFAPPQDGTESTPNFATNRRLSVAKTTQALLGSTTDFSRCGGPNAATPMDRRILMHASPGGKNTDQALSNTSMRAPVGLLHSNRKFVAPRAGSMHTQAVQTAQCSSSAIVHAPAAAGAPGASSTRSGLVHIIASSQFSQWEVRCVLRKNLPSYAAVLSGSYTFPESLCCPLLRNAMALCEASHVTIEHWVTCLEALGARRSGLNTDWVLEMLKGILWKLLSFERSDQSLPNVTVFSPVHVLCQLGYRYNREYVDGHRSIIRRIAEKDSPPTTLMVLCVSQILMEERAGPHQLIAEVTDGWYFARCQLDLPLSQIVRDGLLCVGQKIVVWGASSCRDAACSPLELQHSTGALLNLMFNGVKAASPETPLGAQPPNTVMPIPISCVHPNGGAVPCITGVVSRVLPRFYIDKTPNLTDATPSGTPARASKDELRVVRNALAEARHVETFEAGKAAAYERAMLRMTSDEAAVLMRDQYSRNVTEVTTILLETGTGEAVAIQRMTRGGHGSVEHDDVGSLPKERQWIHVFGLIPSKMANAPPPLNVKLLYVRSNFMFVKTEAPPSLTVAPSVPAYRFSVAVEQSLSALSSKVFGQLVDIVVVCVGNGLHDGQGGSTIVVCGAEKNVFGILAAQMAPGCREIALPSPTPGTVCVIHNAMFACFDESGEYNVVRMHANEYTTVSTRSLSLEIQQSMKSLEAKRGGWSSTMDLGKQLLGGHHAQFSVTAQGFSGGRHGIHEVASYATSLADEHSVGRQIAGPYYMHRPSATPVSSSGVKLVSVTPSTGSTMRPLFDTNSIASASPGGVSSSNCHLPVPHCISADGQRTSSMCVEVQRHVFGNFSIGGMAITTRQIANDANDLSCDDAQEYRLLAELSCSLSEDTPTALCGSCTAMRSSIVFRMHFDSHVGPIDTKLSSSIMAAMCDQVALTPQQLSALATSDENFHLAASRSLLLGSADAHLSPSEAWADFWLHSVVVPASVVSLLLNEARRTSLADDGEITLTTSMLVASSSRMTRWNDVLVPDPHRLLWWTTDEWHQLIVELEQALQQKLFKLTLGNGFVIEKLFCLKDHCPIGDLID